MHSGTEPERERSMAAPYLLELRLGQPIKDELKEIIRDVADEFGVEGAVRTRPVPHITLFGPYNTDSGHEAKARTRAVLEHYGVVPYRVSGFGHFDRGTIYAHVEPSTELRNLRRDLARELRPIAYNYPDHDEDDSYDFHSTIAFKDIEDQYDDIWRYVNDRYQPEYEEHATRVTALKNREMMWEWDIPRGEVLSSGEATTKRSWDETMAALERMQSPSDLHSPDQKTSVLDKLRRFF
jgi:2'-5' RNA ligase